MNKYRDRVCLHGTLTGKVVVKHSINLKMRMNVDQFNSPPGDYTAYDLIQEISIHFSHCVIEICNHDYWIIYCIGYGYKIFYELDLYCSQSISYVPCLSDCEWYGSIIQINSEHSLKIMSCNYNDIIAQVDFNFTSLFPTLARSSVN